MKTALAAYETEEREAIAALGNALAEIPNAPLDDVPDGADENGNVELPARTFRKDPHLLPAEGAFRHRRGAGPHGFRDGRENFRRAICGE